MRRVLQAYLRQSGADPIDVSAQHPSFPLGALVQLGISGDIPGRPKSRGAALGETFPGQFCCGIRSSSDRCASGQKLLDPGREGTMEALRLKPSGGGGRVEAATLKLHGGFPISSASWFYIVVVMLCFLGLCICFSCKKFRHRLLGLDEQTNESEREAVSEMSSSNELPEDVEPLPSPCATLDLRSAHRRTCADRSLDIEMTELPQLPTNPPPSPESVFLD